MLVVKLPPAGSQLPLDVTDMGRSAISGASVSAYLEEAHSRNPFLAFQTAMENVMRPFKEATHQLTRPFLVESEFANRMADIVSGPCKEFRKVTEEHRRLWDSVSYSSCLSLPTERWAQLTEIDCIRRVADLTGKSSDLWRKLIDERQESLDGFFATSNDSFPRHPRIELDSADYVFPKAIDTEVVRVETFSRPNRKPRPPARPIPTTFDPENHCLVIGRKRKVVPFGIIAFFMLLQSKPRVPRNYPVIKNRLTAESAVRWLKRSGWGYLVINIRGEGYSCSEWLSFRSRDAFSRHTFELREDDEGSSIRRNPDRFGTDPDNFEDESDL